MTTFDPFSSWTPDWGNVENQPFATQESSSSFGFGEDPFASFDPFSTPLTGRGTLPPPISLSEIDWALSTSSDRAKTLRDYLSKLEELQISDPKIIEFLFNQVNTEFGMPSKEIITLCLYASKSLEESSHYLATLFICSPDQFIEHITDFQMTPAVATDYAKKLLKQKKLEACLQLVLAQKLDLHGTSIDSLVPIIQGMATPFSWPSFLDHVMTLSLDETERMRIFSTISSHIRIEEAAPLFVKLQIQDPSHIENFAKELLLRSPKTFSTIFSQPDLSKHLPTLANYWIDTHAISDVRLIQDFPLDLIESREEKLNLTMKLASSSPLMVMENLLRFHLENESDIVQVAKILAALEPEDFALKLEDLRLKDRNNINSIVEILVKNFPEIESDTKENLKIFLNELASVRLGERKNKILKHIFNADRAELERLFSTLPLTQTGTKCKNCFVPCVFARFLHGKTDTKWEAGAAKNYRVFKQSGDVVAAIQLMEKINEKKSTLTENDIDLLYSQFFSDKDSVPERNRLLQALLDLGSEAVLAREVIPLAGLKNIFNVRSIELLEFSEEEKAAILLKHEEGTTFQKVIEDKLLSWRSPYTIFLFLIKIDTMPQADRVIARAAAKEFLTAYLSNEYETWRYERSPHLESMRRSGALNADLQNWWQENPAPLPLDANTTIELSSNPNDFMLSGEECGGCQRLNSTPDYVLPLLGLTDGVAKVIVIRNKQTGKMVTRAYLRFVTDKDSNKPVLLLEAPYSFQHNPIYTKAIFEFAKNHAATATQNLPVVTSPYFLPIFDVKTSMPNYPKPLSASGCFAPSIYSDAYGFEVSKGEGGFKTNGLYTLLNTVQINS